MLAARANSVAAVLMITRMGSFWEDTAVTSTARVMPWVVDFAVERFLRSLFRFRAMGRYLLKLNRNRSLKQTPRVYVKSDVFHGDLSKMVIVFDGWNTQFIFWCKPRDRRG